MFFFYSIYDKIINKTVKDKKMYNVLIADDNLQIVSILKEYCKKNNFNVTLAHDGEETLEKIDLMFVRKCVPSQMFQL